MQASVRLAGMKDAYLPPDLDPDRIIARLGLISDTHMPDRWAALQPAILRALSAVDLILHAGDVGELWVLDELSALVPVVAVHGNDEPAEATAALPYQQLLTFSGCRLLLCHSHLPEHAAEMAVRQYDDWQSKLETRADHARRHGATISVSGHLHIPFVVEQDGVWLVNPGAIASGGPSFRQTVQTVARLYLRDDGVPIVTHVDVTGDPRPHAATVDWDKGFAAAAARYQASILEPGLEQVVRAVRDKPYARDRRLGRLLTELGRPVWAGERASISMAGVRQALAASPAFSEEEKRTLLRLLDEAVSG